MSKKLTNIVRKLTSPRGWAHGLFWSWNVIFLAFMFFGFAPQILPEMLVAVRTSEIPGAFPVYAVILTIIPAAAIAVGILLLRRQPGKLFTLGYGIEGPLMLMLGIRFFVVREVTPAVALLLIVAGLGMAAFLWQILDRNIHARGALLAHLRVVGLTLLLVTGLYAGLWIAFYAVPLGAHGWGLFVDMLANLGTVLGNLWDGLSEIITNRPTWLPFAVLGFILLIYTGTLFVLMPLAIPILYIRAWWRGVRGLAKGYGQLRAVALTALVLAACVGLFVQTNRQPQQQAFALLKEPPATIEQAKALLAQEETIRAGLLNAYLAPQRYISSVGEVRHVQEMYRWKFNMLPEQAQKIQQLYEGVARPLLYQPVAPPEPGSHPWEDQSLRKEPLEAAKLYKKFFDQPITKGERDAVLRAVRSTWSIEQAIAGQQAVDDREVLLTQQEVTVSEHGDWAEVELYEVYQNQTSQRQEVVYYFSLPESAVITGVWLGNSPNLANRFTYRVAPRGAAQATYRNEVRYNRDPALMEQIGPRQYRLRIFPIEPQQIRWNQQADRSYIQEGPPLHLWLTWRVLAAGNAWPLPKLAEKRNVYWNDSSVRLVNGQPMPADEETWLPKSVPATAPVQPVTHRVDFPGGESVVIKPAQPKDLPQPANNLQLAVVLDRSRSMAPHKNRVNQALARLAELTNNGTTVDTYLTSSPYRGQEPSRVRLNQVEPESIVYYGGQNAAELLAQFDTLSRGQQYDAILVLTDGTGYELGKNDIEVPTPGAPVWMVHLDGDFSLGYDDATLEAIQASGGGVAGSVEEALTRLTIWLEAGQSSQSSVNSDLFDGYVWLTGPTGAIEQLYGEPAVTHGPGDDFVALAARRLILVEVHRQGGRLDQLDTLDYLHDIAVEHSVVTPYSSMIVLVEKRQEELLNRLEAGGDRFEREYEEVGETVPENAPIVTGVPEPEEWLLLALVAAMLGWYGYTARRRSAPGLRTS